jgi:pyruvate formate lyase activating enzyme
MMEESLMGRISAIQRLSTGDGPGMRTTVFFKGCPLRCTWCHNPETWSYSYSIGWKKRKCIGCKCCIKVCPSKAIALDKDGLYIDRKRCSVCGLCATECPAKALIRYGRDYTIQELTKELAKDKAYFRNSGGGVTLSGGEVLSQGDFAIETASLLRKDGISVAFDTSAYGNRDKLLALGGLCDMILVDIKVFDAARHRELTGQDNELILENILALARDIRKRNNGSMWIRTPVIPGCTNDVENIQSIGHFIKEYLRDVVDRWDLILFHNMCKDKYEELRIPWPHADTPLITKAGAAAISQVALESGLPEGKTYVLGLAVEAGEE